jgi:hypothetical protein
MGPGCVKRAADFMAGGDRSAPVSGLVGRPGWLPSRAKTCRPRCKKGREKLPPSEMQPVSSSAQAATARHNSNRNAFTSLILPRFIHATAAFGTFLARPHYRNACMRADTKLPPEWTRPLPTQTPTIASVIRSSSMRLSTIRFETKVRSRYATLNLGGPARMAADLRPHQIALKSGSRE